MAADWRSATRSQPGRNRCQLRLHLPLSVPSQAASVTLDDIETYFSAVRTQQSRGDTVSRWALMPQRVASRS